MVAFSVGLCGRTQLEHHCLVFELLDSAQCPAPDLESTTFPGKLSLIQTLGFNYNILKQPKPTFTPKPK